MPDTKYLIQERSQVNGQPTVRAVQWGIADKSESDRIAASLTQQNASDRFATPAAYAVVEYES